MIAFDIGANEALGGRAECRQVPSRDHQIPMRAAENATVVQEVLSRFVADGAGGSGNVGVAHSRTVPRPAGEPRASSLGVTVLSEVMEIGPHPRGHSAP